MELTDSAEPSWDQPERILEVDAARARLSSEDPLAAEVVKLHYFAGLALDDVAKLLGLSRATAYRQWSYARSWLKVEIENSH